MALAGAVGVSVLARLFTMRSVAVGWLCILGVVVGWVFLSVLTRGSSHSLAGKRGNLNSKDVAELGWDEISLCKIRCNFSVFSSFEGHN